MGFFDKFRLTRCIFDRHKDDLIELIKLNLGVYFSARSRGLDEEEALKYTVRTRYPEWDDFDVEVFATVTSDLDGWREKYGTAFEKEIIKALILKIFYNETPKGLVDDESRNKMSAKIDEIYEEMKRKV